MNTTLLVLALLGCFADDVVENDRVRLVVDPSRGGLVTSIVARRAGSFPLIAERGADSAASGSLFGVLVQVGGTTVDLGGLACRSRRTGDALLLEGRPAEGLSYTRSIRLCDGESGVSIADRLVNEGKTALRVRLMGRSTLAPEPWRRCLL